VDVGPQTRIETLHPPPSTGEPNWVRGNVRDVNVSANGALALASWLRRTGATHGFNKRTRCLTVYDVHNVQALAHRLVMEKLRFW
jgi:hypothetical protein